MPDYPLLVFPQRDLVERRKRSSGPDNYRLPPHAEQVGRIGPQLRALERLAVTRAGQLQATPIGVLPEQVLVFETVGSIDEFAVAVRHTEGMEWLGEWFEEDSAPDEFFYRRDAPDRQIETRLYFVSSNQRAITQLLGLWERYAADATEPMPRGQAKWKQLFARLRAVRRWDARDRLMETGLVEDWSQRLAVGQGLVRLEAEFWFRGREQDRAAAEAEFRVDVERAGGEVIRSLAINEIAYHAVIANIPADAAAEVLRIPPSDQLGGGSRRMDWLYVDHVMFFRPVGQVATFVDHPAEAVAPTIAGSMPSGAPIAALLDGLPLENHLTLAGRLVVDDPNGVANSYPARDRRHGTAMASLIIHGDLSVAGAPISSPLYAMPVMGVAVTPFGVRECIPEDVLAVDAIHAAVRRMFVNGAGTPTAPTARVINLSLGDPSRLFFHYMSPWARLLDWLSVEHNVLFVVSAGNHAHDLVLDVPRGQLPTDPQELQAHTLRAVMGDARNRRLLSPAESINAVTVGACHADFAQTSVPAASVNPVVSDACPSPISSLGLGFRRAIKPDILAPGGRQLYRVRPGNTHHEEILQANRFARPLGLSVAAPGPAGELDRRDSECGTSHAAALVTRGVVRVIENLRDLDPDESFNSVPEEYEPVVAKALIAHCASWGKAHDDFATVVQGDSRSFRETVTRCVGYGCVDVERVLACTAQRVTLLGFGTVSDGSADLYRMPLPPALSAQKVWRRLTVTLAWFSPVRPLHQKYRGAALWFSIDGARPLVGTRSDADFQAAMRGTLQHEMFFGDAAVPISDHDDVIVRVNCRADAGLLRSPVRYGLAVTFEVAPETAVPVYEQVRERVQPRLAVQLRSPR